MPKTITVDFSVDDTQPSIAALLRRVLDGASQPIVTEDIVIDLTTCEFLGPSAVVTLVALKRIADTQGRQLGILPPHLPRLLNYCRYSGLLAEFQAGPAPENHPDNVTTPVHVFNGALPLGGIEAVVSLAKNLMSISPVASEDLTLLLTELTQNVLDHSQSPIGGLLSARAYKDVRDVRFAVADLGLGIRRTLATRLALGSDKEAIRYAIREEVTGKTLPRNLGLGLSHLHDIVRLTGGRMVLCSGNGYLRHEKGKDFFGQGDVSFPGTIAFVRLPARQLDADGPDATEIWA
jgi:hypothetical protein